MPTYLKRLYTDKITHFLLFTDMVRFAELSLGSYILKGL